MWQDRTTMKSSLNRVLSSTVCLLTISASLAVSGCVARQALPGGNPDASGNPPPDDAAVAMSCALQAVTDIVPVASANSAYAGLTSNGASLFVINPADQRLAR